jgi:hypothetical protein
VNVVAPFKLQDYVVGFKYALGNFNKLPESVFAKKSFDTPGDGKLAVDANFVVADNSVRLAASWFSSSLGLTVGALANSNNPTVVTKMEAQKDTVVGNSRISVNAAYDIPHKVAQGFVSAELDGTLVQVDVSTDAQQDPVLSVTRALDAQNEVTPSISLKSGHLTYAWRRRWAGGSLQAKLLPSDPSDRRLELDWADEGSLGTWNTHADFPLDGAAAATSKPAKITIGRDWKY